LRVNNLFSRNFFVRNYNKAKSLAGNRFTPELHVELPISNIFDYLVRHQRCYTALRKIYGIIHKKSQYLTSNVVNDQDSSLKNFYTNSKTLNDVLNHIREYNTNSIDWIKINELSENLIDISYGLINAVNGSPSSYIKTREHDSRSTTDRTNYVIHDFHEYIKNIRKIHDLSQDTEAQIFNSPYLLLTGDAGIGKTHLLCDLAGRLINENEDKITPCIICFGEQFNDAENFWETLFKFLEVTTTKNAFLSELNTLAEQNNQRALIIIDALNENVLSSPNYWKTNLLQILEDVKQYPNIALIVSIRSGFEKIVLDNEITSSFSIVQHDGFASQEWEALTKFFLQKNLPLPEVPLLTHEFSNPLFLKLFCQAFDNPSRTKKGQEFFKGHIGATTIFENYVDTVAYVLEDRFNISHLKNKNIWDTVIENIAKEMSLNYSDRIPLDKLIEIVKNNHPSVDHAKLIESLEQAMLISKIPNYSSNESNLNFEIRFPFQKFSDFLISRYIFKKLHSEIEGRITFDVAKEYFCITDGIFDVILKKNYNLGLIEALSIALPEHTRGDIELIGLFDVYAQHSGFKSHFLEAFIQSIIWRSTSGFNDDLPKIISTINNYIVNDDGLHTKFIDALLAVSSVSDHPFNAEFLHSHLNQYSMAERDAWWSTFLHYTYNENKSVDRLLKWGISNSTKSLINDSTLLLTGITLVWFLTSSNRFIRDKATKCLVNIFTSRLIILKDLLVKFENVNDIYVLERIYAAAYGCIMLSNQSSCKIDDVRNLVDYICDYFYVKNNLPVHLLLRDYIRGIVELSVKKFNLCINTKFTIPPYSSMLDLNVPSAETIKKQYYDDKDSGYTQIVSSVMYNLGFLADFGNYVINSKLRYWSSGKIQDKEINRIFIFEIFIKNLSSYQKQLWSNLINYINSSRAYDSEMLHTILYSNEANVANINISFDHNVDERSAKLLNFKKSLLLEQQIYYVIEVEPYLNYKYEVTQPKNEFDTGLAQRWIFTRVLSLGFDPNIHSYFDEVVSRNSHRTEHKAERIGEKYQWIALHEFLAFVSDNYRPIIESWDNDNKQYQGSWDPFIRDIDPSFLLQCDSLKSNDLPLKQWRRNLLSYDAWGNQVSIAEWVTTLDDIPKLVDLVNILDDNNSEWILLDGSFKWDDHKDPAFEKYDIGYRSLWIMITSLIVKKSEYRLIVDDLKQRDLYNINIDFVNRVYETFLGEYHNSSAFECKYGEDLWQEFSISGNKTIDVLPTFQYYLNEFTLDCSVDDVSSIKIKLLCKEIVDDLNLHHTNLDGKFYDVDGALVGVYQPIFEESQFETLLIKKETLTKFLECHDYSILWISKLEKNVVERMSLSTYCDFGGLLFYNEQNNLDMHIVKSNSNSFIT